MEISETTAIVGAGVLLLPKLIEMGVTFVKWSVGRNVAAVDEEKKSAASAAGKLSERVDKLDRELLQLQAAHSSHKDAMNTAMGSIDGRLIALDNRVAAQGKAYEVRIDEGFRKLEIELNRKLAQVVAERRGRAR